MYEFVLKTSICLLLLNIIIVKSASIDYVFGPPKEKEFYGDRDLWLKAGKFPWTSFNFNKENNNLPCQLDPSFSEEYEEPFNSCEEDNEDTRNYHLSDDEIARIDKDNDTTTTTTTTTTTEAPKKNCPPNKTKFAENDVKQIIDEIVKDMNITEEIKSSYHANALKVKDRHAHVLEHYMEGFHERPKHLKHILEAIAKKRQQLEPAVEKIASFLKQYPTLDENYKKMLNNKTELQKEYEKIRKICDLNCGKHENKAPPPPPALGQYLGDRYYCGTYRELSKKIKDELNKFVVTAKTNMTSELNYLDEKYNKTIYNLTNDLKKHAIKEFGPVMYDLLSLQDDYVHFEERIKDNTMETYFYDIKRNNGNSKLLLMEIQRKLPLFRTHCLNCKSSSESLLLSSEYRLRNADKDLVDILVDNKTKESMNITEKDFNVIFEELNKKINESSSLEKNMKYLEPIKYEIEGDTKKEYDNLENLTNKVSDINLIAHLYNESMTFLSSLQEIDVELKNVYHIN